jgi:peptidoglycan/xylan/chitin deacetylase (PgdA/CDA1 family)
MVVRLTTKLAEKIATCLISATLVVGLVQCGQPTALATRQPHSYQQLALKYRGRTPSAWGANVQGVLTRVHTKRKEILLTLDACGEGKKGNGFDSKLLAYLEREHIPATLFLSGRWIDANPQVARRLAANPLFEIENHGLRHKPCSVNGRAAYGIRGTSGITDVIDEVDGNARKIEALTGRRPKFYRSGTAMYDEVAVAIVRDMGCTPVGFTLSGDEGATLSLREVKARLLKASSGDIVLCHMNRPEGQTAEGVMAAIPIMLKRGFKFVRLDAEL